MKDYFINNKTLAIIPYEDKYSKVYEEGRIIVVKRRPNTIIKNNCIYNGSTLEGRLCSTYNLTGYSYKAPILVNNKDVYFPTTSMRLKECCWINASKIKKYKKSSDDNSCNIYFYDGSCIEIKQSNYIINNQFLKALRLDTILRNLWLQKT